jgi:hypothetical protein
MNGSPVLFLGKNSLSLGFVYTSQPVFCFRIVGILLYRLKKEIQGFCDIPLFKCSFTFLKKNPCRLPCGYPIADKDKKENEKEAGFISGHGDEASVSAFTSLYKKRTAAQ